MKGAALAVDEKRLVRAVAERTWLSTEESADITRAVVQGLAGQLSEGEARRLAGDLPESLADQLPVERRRRQGAHPVDVATFISELSERTGLTGDDARAGTGAVLTVLRETLGQEDFGHLIGQARVVRRQLADAAG
jgi:uncharacterized protein (DUF2267 family)